MIWSKVEVDWCEEWKCWTVGTYDNDGNRSHYGEYFRKEWAIADAVILAFESDVDEQRAPKVEVYTKKYRLIKTITEWE